MNYSETVHQDKYFPTILIVDDDAHVREDLQGILKDHSYPCLQARDGKEALDCIKVQRVALLLLDLRLPRVDGLSVLKQCLKSHPDVPVIMVSGQGTIAAAVEATKLGAFDFLEKPLETERTLLTVRRALETRCLPRQPDNSPAVPRRGFKLTGDSPQMQEVHGFVNRAARVDSRVLICGESGTGKELVASAIHYNSSRAAFPFVPLNCSAIPEALIESTLFGHEKGAFTGATTNRQGKFQQADRGTLFLDEIGDMSLMAQAKVLRVIEDGFVEPVGSNKQVPVDVRIIAATCKDLKAEIENRRFRCDLFYRLNVLTVYLPPLRERKNDLPVLAESLLQEICDNQGLPPMTFAPQVLPILQQYDWPGNVRELRNVLERAAVFSDDMSISALALAEAIHATSQRTANNDGAQTLREAREKFEKKFIEQTLTAHGGKIQETAEILGIQRSHLWKKMQQYGIEKTQ
jgi:two-component system nitrogen regulation response regulator NtrX